MSANRCPNSKCEYFNRVLPNNAKVCPMCGTPLGNAIAPKSSTPPNTSSPPKVVNQTDYPASINPPSYQSSSVPYVEQPPPPLPPPSPPAYPPPAAPSAYPPSATPSAYPPPSSPRPVLRLMHSSGREFRFFREDGYIGRRSQMSGRIPEIDLFGIPNEGVVSRAHARIYWDANQNAYIIIDNSRNGTYLNGNFLASGVPYRLSNGDLLQLGQNNLVTFTVSVIF
ncbi:FHA domain-containing protein [Brasilonema octagenarum]|uniref:FHA domain-containing protein n=1 Tax=Brasilonema octagenarum UFV-OR1 TaxID=417115 RepID=A0ABX1M3Z1_9CYAN|nr:FHA domain-containing protein [Brasilonema octagenarum]NMF62530.1 FHA domain-containing protein [Brasilonema octagenarum UFV-OR1]